MPTPQCQPPLPVLDGGPSVELCADRARPGRMTEAAAQGKAVAQMGYTLVEMLAVLGVILLLLGLLVPAFNSIKGSSDMTAAAYDLAGLLSQARTYAMSNNTYVFVGIAEEDNSRPSTASPQVPATASVGGRVAIMAFAAKDGTRGYSLDGPTTTWANEYNTSDAGATQTPGFRLTALTKLHRFENVHLVALPNPTGGNMLRPAVNTAGKPSYQVSDAACAAVTPIAYPLGSALGAGQYNFFKVINFDPRGVARIQAEANYDVIDLYIEVGLQPTHGNAVPAAPAANQGQQAAVQVDCLTGTVRMYRP